MKKILALLLAAMLVAVAAFALAEEAGFEETPIALDGSKSADDADYFMNARRWFCSFLLCSGILVQAAALARGLGAAFAGRTARWCFFRH